MTPTPTLVTQIQDGAVVLGWFFPALPPVLRILIGLLFVIGVICLAIIPFGLFKKKKDKKPQKASEDKSPALTAKEIPLPKWISELDAITVGQRSSRERSQSSAAEAVLQDTLIIGLGPAGREVLSQIALVLNNKYGEDWPENVQVLQFDIQIEGETPPVKPAFLADSQWVVLKVNPGSYKEKLKLNPDQWQHLDWFTKTAPSYDRSYGRLALFADLQNGINQSKFWNAIQKSFLRMNKPAVRVVGTTFDDVSSGMLVDVIRLVQLIREQDIDVQLWLAGPVQQEWSERVTGTKAKVKIDDQAKRTLATIRELERFQRNGKIQYVYVPPKHQADLLRRSFDYGIVQTVFIFDRMTPGISPSDDVFACMADALMAFLYPSIHNEVTTLLKGRTVANAMVNQSNTGLISGLGCFAVRLSESVTSDASSWRLIRDLMFENTIGLLPLEFLDWNTGEFKSSEEDYARVIRELIEKSAIFKPQLDKLIDRIISDKLTEQGFYNEIGSIISTILTGEYPASDQPLKARRGGMITALAFLEMVMVQINRYPSTRKLLPVVNSLKDELTATQSWLQEKLYPVVKHHHESARQELTRYQKQVGRSWLIDETLEWKEYQTSLRTSFDISGSKADNPILQMASRCGWRVQFEPNGKRWNLQLLYFPPEYKYLQGLALEQYLVRQELDVASFLKDFHKFGVRLARLREPKTAMEMALQSSITSWIHQSRCRVDFDEEHAALTLGPILGGYSTTAFLVGQNSPDREKLMKKISLDKENLAARTIPCDIQETQVVFLITLVDKIPLNALTIYNKNAWERTMIPPHLYVWPPEQTAANVEVDHHLSAKFVSLLAEDERMVRLFAQGVIFDIFSFLPGGARLPQLDVVRGETVGKILLALFENPPQNLEVNAPSVLQDWEDRIQKRREAVYGTRAAYFRDIKEKRSKLLISSQVQIDQDLGYYINGLIEQENA